MHLCEVVRKARPPTPPGAAGQAFQGTRTAMSRVTSSAPCRTVTGTALEVPRRACGGNRSCRSGRPARSSRGRNSRRPAIIASASFSSSRAGRSATVSRRTAYGGPPPASARAMTNTGAPGCAPIPGETDTATGTPPATAASPASEPLSAVAPPAHGGLGPGPHALVRELERRPEQIAPRSGRGDLEQPAEIPRRLRGRPALHRVHRQEFEHHGMVWLRRQDPVDGQARLRRQPAVVRQVTRLRPGRLDFGFRGEHAQGRKRFRRALEVAHPELQVDRGETGSNRREAAVQAGPRGRRRASPWCLRTRSDPAARPPRARAPAHRVHPTAHRVPN